MILQFLAGISFLNWFEFLLSCFIIFIAVAAFFRYAKPRSKPPSNAPQRTVPESLVYWVRRYERWVTCFAYALDNGLLAFRRTKRTPRRHRPPLPGLV